MFAVAQEGRHWNFSSGRLTPNCSILLDGKANLMKSAIEASTLVFPGTDVLKLHERLGKAESSLGIQLRTGTSGLDTFLF
jgi:hypothetical protein